MACAIDSFQWIRRAMVGLLGASIFLLAHSEPSRSGGTRFTAVIPQEVWAMSQDPLLVREGAVVLEDHWRIGVEFGSIERTYRVRILNSLGRSGAQFHKFLGKLSSLEGRVVYPNGTFLILNRENDFIEKTFLEFRGHEIKQNVLIPPGINSDCVFELYFKVSGNFKDDGIKEYIFGNLFSTRQLVVELGNQNSLSTLFMPMANAKLESIKNNNSVLIKIKDIPSFEILPFRFGLTPYQNRFFMYSPEKYLSKSNFADASDFWNTVVKDKYRKFFNFNDAENDRYTQHSQRPIVVTAAVKKGLGYKALLGQLSAELPAEPQARGRELWNRLSRQIQRWSRIAPEEGLDLQRRGIDVDHLDSQDLESAIKNGGTHSLGWMLLYYHLVRDSGVNPQILCVTSVWKRPFLPNLRSTAQFDWMLLRINEEGKFPLFLDAGPRFAPAGLISPQFQGAQAFSIDSNNWAVGTALVGWQSPNDHVSEYSFELKPEALGTVLFYLSTKFYGMADHEERSIFVALDSAARISKLLTSIEQRNLEWVGDCTNMGDPLDLSVPYSWAVVGRMSIAEKGILFIRPFPGLPDFFPPQDLFPPSREEPLFLGIPKIQRSKCRIEIPPGYRLRASERFEKANSLGSISWEAHQANRDRDAAVEMEILLKQGLVSAGKYQECREFLTWVRDASRKLVVLEEAP